MSKKEFATPDLYTYDKSLIYEMNRQIFQWQAQNAAHKPSHIDRWQIDT
jgi:hypothetical protein